MVRVAIGFLVLCALVTAVNAARADGLFQETITLRNGQLLVVEESSLEPRSIGSYNLRLYSGENPKFPYDRFIAGLVYPRDGVLEAVTELDPEQCDACFTVCMRSAGTGNYLAQHLYSYAGNRLTLQSETTMGCSKTMSCGELDKIHQPTADTPP